MKVDNDLKLTLDDISDSFCYKEILNRRKNDNNILLKDKSSKKSSCSFSKGLNIIYNYIYCRGIYSLYFAECQNSYIFKLLFPMSPVLKEKLNFSFNILSTPPYQFWTEIKNIGLMSKYYKNKKKSPISLNELTYFSTDNINTDILEGYVYNFDEWDKLNIRRGKHIYG